MTTITFSQAASEFNRNESKREIEKQEAIEEIKTSHFDCYDAYDIQALAQKAGMIPNEVRYLNAESQGINPLDLLHTFENDETDDIIDFY